MSSDPLPSVEVYLASSTRVHQGSDSLQDLVDAFSTLERKALISPSTLTDHERRQLLDLPNAEDESRNIQQVSSRSREDLLSTMLSEPHILSDDELTLLKRGFWSAASTKGKLERVKKRANATAEATDRVWKAREPAYLPNEYQSLYGAASTESWRRHTERRDNMQRNSGGPDPPAWMHSLNRRLEEQPGLHAWGYVAFLDAEAQAMDEERRDLFERRIEAMISQTMDQNGAYKSLLNQKWKLALINAPPGAYASLEPDADHSKFREAFRDLMDKDKEYTISQAPDVRSAKEILDGCQGILTNTFLVINKTCVDSILEQTGYLNDMRILAFEAEFPNPNETYLDDGYPGWTWVRVEQIIDDFYAARMNDSPGMDVIWKAAQGSKHQAFASLDPEEAKIWTTSTSMTGHSPKSILGKRYMDSGNRQL